MKTYKLTTNNAKNINDFCYMLCLGDNILYANGIYENVKKFAKMVQLENEFAGVSCNFIYEC